MQSRIHSTPRSIDPDALWRTLRRTLSLNGPAEARVLVAELGVSQPTFSRLVAAHRDDLVTTGRTRSTRYAARRRIEGLPSVVPLYEVLGEGPARTRLLARLHPVEPAGFLVESDTPLAGFYPGVPWFLDDLRPAGFLGRLAPVHHPELGFSRDILAWSNDQVVTYLHQHGHDLVGNLVLGEPTFLRHLHAGVANAVPLADRAERYPALAADMVAAGIPGSSAAGEQPKFLATRLDGGAAVPVLVKFSPPVGDAVGRRVADLLVCEHVALSTIAAHGPTAARSTLLHHGGRTFLEVERFDRSGATGRRGVVSLRVLDAEFVGEPTSWTSVATALTTQRRIDAATFDQILWLERFGAWIGNTDRHLGNLSLRLDNGVLGGLAPAYDMLPMVYAPRNNELVPVELGMPMLSPTRTDVWMSTWAAAVTFWERVACHLEVSPDFGVIARDNMGRVAAQRSLLDRLPGHRTTL
ncbi:MAG: type II toxin-antitoxin system HipA family toxin YjjJ [Myxococcota bacterium]